MLIHIVPQLHLPGFHGQCLLIDVSLPELGLIYSDEQVVARRPYPNQDYLVACHAGGDYPVSGLLTESTTRLSVFSVMTRWYVEEGGGRVLTHHVRHQVMDGEYDAVSGCMALWYARGAWESRFFDSSMRPLSHQPRMMMRPLPGYCGEITAERLDDAGRLHSRTEVFRLPTIQRRRILNVG